MESQSARPREVMSPRFWAVGVRLGDVESAEATSGLREAWKVFRQLIVRGMPLKLMHFRPISRMNSAVGTSLPLAPCAADATRCSAGNESGELSVNVAAAYHHSCQYGGGRGILDLRDWAMSAHSNC